MERMGEIETLRIISEDPGPERRVSARQEYSFDIGSTPRIEVTYTDGQYFDSGNTAEISQIESTTLLNAGVTLESLRGGWTLAVGVNDLGDKIFPIAGNSSLTSNSGYAEIAYNRGREASATFTKEFWKMEASPGIEPG